jgi:hypothetical protein
LGRKLTSIFRVESDASKWHYICLLPVACALPASCFPYSSILKTKALESAEMPLEIYRTYFDKAADVTAVTTAVQEAEEAFL